MRIAFIGGTGFIGSVAVKEALDRGHDVMVIHRGSHPSTDKRALDVLLDRTDAVQVEKALREFHTDSVVDTYAMTKRDAHCTLEALRNIRLPLVVISSQDVYAQFGSLHGHPLNAVEERVNEESELTVPYPFRGILEHDGGDDYDKKDVEQVFRDAVDRNKLQSVTVLRLPATYGNGDPQQRFGSVIDRIRHGQCTFPQINGAKWRWTHAHVADVAVAIALATEQQTTGYRVYNVGEETALSMREWTEAIAKQMRTEISWEEVEELSTEDRIYGIMPNDFIVDTSKIRMELGYKEKAPFTERLQELIGD